MGHQQRLPLRRLIASRCVLEVTQNADSCKNHPLTLKSNPPDAKFLYKSQRKSWGRVVKTDALLNVVVVDLAAQTKPAETCLNSALHSSLQRESGARRKRTSSMLPH